MKQRPVSHQHGHMASVQGHHKVSKANKNPSPEGAAYKKKDIAKNFQVPQMVSLSETPEQEVNNLL